jgi:hypothetical protein
MLLVMERFGYPEYLLASADALLAGQYADRPQDAARHQVSQTGRGRSRTCGGPAGS